MNNQEKVLVCITIQKNSKRLIEQGAKLAEENNGTLHILHVEKGMSIFENPESALLLEELFKYGKELGGEVHFISDDNVPKRIITFIRDMEITKIILGETKSNRFYQLLKRDINAYISKETDGEVVIIKRNNEK